MTDPMSVKNQSFGLDPDAFSPRQFLFDGGTIVTINEAHGNLAYVRDDDSGLYLVNATTATTNPLRIDPDSVAEYVNNQLADPFTTDVTLHTELPDRLDAAFEFDSPDALTKREFLLSL